MSRRESIPFALSRLIHAVHCPEARGVYIFGMVHGQSVLGVITARGGSKRMPRKNLRALAGQPLIAWTIDAARKSEVLDRTVLSSDDEEIMATARALGCEVPFVRPAHLSSDHASSVETVLHAMDAIGEEYDWVVLLQPTSPFRLGEDIDACVRKGSSSGATACIAVTEPEQSPYLSFRLDEANRLEPLLECDLSHARSQDLPKTYSVNGAVYAATSSWLRENKTFIHRGAAAYVMPRERSVDIDTEQDFLFAEAIYRHGRFARSE
jgi:N-acylneuraminate cytidylyltransferase